MPAIAVSLSSMPSFTALLIHTADIQAKTLNTSGYEQLPTWTNIATAVPCRHDYDSSVSISDAEMRVNTDDDIFFFNPEVVIDRGNRIVSGGQTFDVINVNKLYNSTVLHHLEVTSRLVDTK